MTDLIDMQRSAPNNPIVSETAAEAIPCVLIVEDDPQAGALFRDLIREEFDPRARVFEATDGQTALLLAQQHAIDVALVDYRLPDLDGLKVLAGLQRTSSNPASLLISGEGSEQLAAQALQAGAQDYLVKVDLHIANVGRRMREAMATKQRTGQATELAEQMRREHEELDYLVRALSHDMNANFMLLQNSFRHLQRSTAEVATPQVEDDLAHLEACLTQARRLLHDLVTLGNTGRVDMQPSRVSLNDVVSAVMYEQQDLLAESDIELEIEPDLPQLWCNAERLNQIVTNLVRNAARHGAAAARAKISVRGGQTFGEAPMAWFRITDNGRGIPAEQRETIFQPGTRLATAHPQGSGMGLAIVDKLARRMGGSVRVVSDAGSGASFEVRLPAPAATLPADVRLDPAESGGRAVREIGRAAREQSPETNPSEMKKDGSANHAVTAGPKHRAATKSSRPTQHRH